MENEEAQKVRKKYIVQSLIKRIEEDNVDCKIKTNHVEGFKNSEKIIRKDNDKMGYVPDIISETRGRIDLYEIELNERNYDREKWKLFSLYTEKYKGSLNIVIPKNNLDHLKEMLELNKISAKIIYF